MGWGKIKKGFGKAVNKITGGNNTLNKVLGVALAPVTGGTSMVVSNAATNQLVKQAEKKEAGIRAAEEAAEKQTLQKEYADFEKKILGQRYQRIENAAQSKTDFTSEEDVDPRTAKVDRLLAKKRKLIGFE